jgi:hypothetical protein
MRTIENVIMSELQPKRTGCFRGYAVILFFYKKRVIVELQSQIFEMSFQYDYFNHQTEDEGPKHNVSQPKNFSVDHSPFLKWFGHHITLAVICK